VCKEQMARKTPQGRNGRFTPMLRARLRRQPPDAAHQQQPQTNVLKHYVFFVTTSEASFESAATFVVCPDPNHLAGLMDQIASGPRMRMGIGCAADPFGPRDRERALVCQQSCILLERVAIGSRGGLGSRIALRCVVNCPLERKREAALRQPAAVGRQKRPWWAQWTYQVHAE